jgi:uncharacterized protein (DUF486 family)
MQRGKNISRIITLILLWGTGVLMIYDWHSRYGSFEGMPWYLVGIVVTVGIIYSKWGVDWVFKKEN